MFAGVAQLAEHDVANVVVEGSNPFARSYGFALNPSFRASSSRYFFAGVAQLAEHDVANVVVEGSNPFARSYGGFSGFGHGFRWKQLVPEHLAMPPLSVGTNGAPLFWGALFLRAPRFYPRSSGKTGKRPRFRVFSFFLTALS